MMRHSAPKGGVKRADSKVRHPSTSTDATKRRGAMKSTKNKKSGRRQVPTVAPVEAFVHTMPADDAAEQPVAVAQGPTPESADAVLPVAQSINIVELPAHCTLRDAVALQAKLAACIDAEQAVPVDARAVERIDTAAFQVLLAFVRERAARARAVEWLGLNDTFVESARLLGLHAHLNIPANAGAAS